MAFRSDGYYYDGQLARYVNQFMAIFQGLQVQVGKWNDREEKLIPVEIRYGHMDRVVAALLAENTQNKPIKLPAMSAYVNGLAIDLSRARGTGQERRNTFTPVGGLVPDDMKVVHQRMPIPYNLSIDLNIYTSNTDQHFQILEQILPLFESQLTFQTSDGVFDWTRTTSVFLKDIALDTNFPIGVDRRIVQSKLTFEMLIEIATPAEVRRDFIERIYMRIGTVSTGAANNYEIIAELDAQGIPYELVATADTIPIE